MDNKLPRLVCLGNFTVDDVYLPDGSVVPECLGGDALYAALGARLWEPSVKFIAPLSPDLPERAYQAMHAAGFDPQELPLRNTPTIRNRIYYDAQGGRRWEILATEEEFHNLSPTPQDIPPSYLQAGAFLILAMTLQAQEALLPWLREHTRSIIALDTMEDYVSGNEARIERLIPQVDIFMPSTSEAGKLAGHSDWLAAARQFSAMGPSLVVIKTGEEGALIYDGKANSWFQQPATPVKVVDTTGAGDAFCGGFLAAYLQDQADLRRAARLASISASYAVASFGMSALLSASPAQVAHHLSDAGVVYGD
jgi:ribokinase